MTTFAERLRRLRQDAGLSQTQLAGDGLSPSYISLLESGKRKPSPEVGALLARKLGCSVSLLLDGEPSERERRVELEMAYARLALEHSRADDARDRLLVLLQEDGLPQHVRDDASWLLARAHEKSGDLRAAAEILLPLMARARTRSTHLPLPTTAMVLCHCYKQAGDLHRAIAVGEEAVIACDELGLTGSEEYYRLAATLMAAYGDLGDDLHAGAWARQLIAGAEASGVRGGQAALYWNAAEVAERQGRIDEALTLTQRALAHLGELGDSRDLARLRVAAALVMLAADPPKLQEAITALERNRPLLEDLGSRTDLAEWDYARSWAALLEHDLPTALRLAESSVAQLEEFDAEQDAVLAAHAHVALGDALAAHGRIAEVRDAYAAAARFLAGPRTGRMHALAWRELGERLSHEGDVRGAADAFRRALDAAGIRDRSHAVLGAIDAARATASTTASPAEIS